MNDSDLILKPGLYPLSSVYRDVCLEMGDINYHTITHKVFARIVKNPRFFSRVKKEKVDYSSVFAYPPLERISVPILDGTFVAQITYDRSRVPHVDSANSFETAEAATCVAMNRNTKYFDTLGYDFLINFSKKVIER